MPDQTISAMLENADNPLLSFEFFPPKHDEAMLALGRTVERLLPAKPDFVTVTYGAGGSTQRRTLSVCRHLEDSGFSPVMPHLTCVGSSRDELRAIADRIYDAGLRTIMTLRGDPPKGQTEFRPHPNGLQYASELVALLKERHHDFCCGVAGYPEAHPEAASPEADIEHLKRKIDAGGDFITTQLFFDNRMYFEFLDRCRAAGIDVPIIPGLLPAVSFKQATRICTMCKAGLPDELARELENAPSPEAGEEIGIAWVARQMEELLRADVPGIHLYILNRERPGLALAIGKQFDSVRRFKA